MSNKGLTLENLNKRLELILKQNPEYNDNKVLVTLCELSMGARASEVIKSANIGFDWERGQFRLNPSEPLIHKSKDRDKPMNPIKKKMPGNTRSYYYCVACQQKISKNDGYCKTCGQRIGR